jgi:isopenicillin N synthase-like dioxygenase
MGSVPVIDMADRSSREFPRRLGRAFEDIGFAVITGHGIDKRLMGRVYAASALLFAHGDDVLRKYERQELNHQVGFAPMGTEKGKDGTVPDVKRFWHIRRPGGAGAQSNVWPDEVPFFGVYCTQLFHELDNLAYVLLFALDQFLGLAPLTLPEMVERGNTLMRVLHYPAPEGNEPEGAVRSFAHEDINLITLLVAATASGLEVKDRAGNWVSVNETPGSIVVNVGDMLQMFTKRRLVSTTHHVVNSPDERYSLPFFVHPRPEVVLDRETGFTAGQYLAQRLQEIQGHLDKK